MLRIHRATPFWGLYLLSSVPFSFSLPLALLWLPDMDSRTEAYASPDWFLVRRATTAPATCYRRFDHWNILCIWCTNWLGPSNPLEWHHPPCFGTNQGFGSICLGYGEGCRWICKCFPALWSPHSVVEHLWMEICRRVDRMSIFSKSFRYFAESSKTKVC